MTTAALVVTTYNDPRRLGLCLKAFSNQTSRDFDLFVADDGSKPETKAKIDELRPLIGRPLEHVWHPDHGYRKATINNEVFRRLGAYPVVICVDHDTVAHYRFIEDHLSAHLASPRTLFMGRRVDLGPQLSNQLDEGNVLEFNRSPGLKLLASGLKGDTRNWFRGIRIEAAPFRRMLKRDRVPDLLGSNFSVSRELLFEVNGYDEDYQAYWGEDGDLFVRLRNSGARLVGSKSLAVQFHLDHPRLDPKPEHVQRYEKLLQDREYRRCRRGIVKDP